MLELTTGKIRVYQENDLQTVKVMLFEINFDPNMVDKSTHQMSKNENMGLFLELDIFKPTERELAYLRDENERFAKRIEEMEVTIVEMVECRDRR